MTSLEKKFSFRFKLYLVLGVIALANIATFSLVEKTFPGAIDTGYLDIVVAMVATWLFGTSFATALEIPVRLITDLSLLWVVLAYFNYEKLQKIKKIQQKNQENIEASSD